MAIGDAPEAPAPKVERPESEHFIRPKLSLTLRLEVAKVPMGERPHFQEVAETLEEMVNLVHDKGGEIAEGTHLPQRLHRVPGKTINQARQARIDDVRAVSEARKKEDEKRKKRKEELKLELVKLKEAKEKDEEEKKKKELEDKSKEKRDKKKGDDGAKKRADEIKKKIEESKKVKVDDEEKKKKEAVDKETEGKDERKK